MKIDDKRNIYIGAIFLVLLVALFIGQSVLDRDDR